MRKTDKKNDHQIRTILTDVCETALKEINGFLWLTHLVNYSNFPKSLTIVCIFDTNKNLSNFISTPNKEKLNISIQKKLAKINVNLKNITNHIVYDSEENCEKEHHSNWVNRLSKIHTS